MNQISRYTFYIFVCILFVVSCKEIKIKKQIPAKEIVERMYSKYHPSDPFVFKYEALYSYNNGVLTERNTKSDQDKTSKEQLYYDENGKLVKTEMHNKDFMLFEEKIVYDENGKWKTKQTFNTKGEKVADLQVTERTNNVVKGAGFIRKSQVRMLSENQGRDSIMLRQIVSNEQAVYQKWAYKKNKKNDVLSIRGYQVDLVSAESFEVSNDSLIASFDYNYHFPPDCPDWSLMMVNSTYQAKSGDIVNRTDSVLRISVSLEDAEITNTLLEGFWQIREIPATSYQFFKEGNYRAYSGNQLAEKGTWNILNSKQKIMFQTIGLNDKKSIKFWNIDKVFKDKITIVMHDKVQSAIRLNKDFTFYKFDNQ